MTDHDSLDRQIEKFHKVIVDLIKRYQFRDRNQICCYGLSVSQCYTMELLHRLGPMTMNQLAENMVLTVSTMTRVVDQLVKKGYATREEYAGDRRIRTIRLTGEGESTFQMAWSDIYESEKNILQDISEENRQKLIQLLESLGQAVSKWQTRCKT
jgi:DNA-binding MarR family transcriptional regulator